MVGSILYTEYLVPTLTVLNPVYTQVPTFVLLGVVTVLLIDIIRVTTAEVTITIARVWTTSCTGLASGANRVDNIPILIISTVGTVVSRGQTALVVGVPSTIGNVTALAGVVLVSANVPTGVVNVIFVINFIMGTCIIVFTGGKQCIRRHLGFRVLIFWT